jgi:hypothetical protein
MTNYTKKSFSVVMGSDAYRDNYDRTFGRGELADAASAATKGEPMDTPCDRVEAWVANGCAGVVRPEDITSVLGELGFERVCRERLYEMVGGLLMRCAGGKPTEIEAALIEAVAVYNDVSDALGFVDVPAEKDS